MSRCWLPGITLRRKNSLRNHTFLLRWIDPQPRARPPPAQRSTLKPETRDALLEAIAKARVWIDDLIEGRVASLAEIARRESTARPSVGAARVRFTAVDFRDHRRHRPRRADSHRASERPSLLMDSAARSAIRAEPSGLQNIIGSTAVTLGKDRRYAPAWLWSACCKESGTPTQFCARLALV